MLELPEVEIRACQKADLPKLEQAFPPGKYHRKRFEDQLAGHATYLIAFLNGEVVGHLLVNYRGADEDEVKRFFERAPTIIGAAVVPELRSQGIGSKMIEKAEAIAKVHGYNRMGLGVGINNPRAKKLYERRGFKSWGQGIYTASWRENPNDSNSRLVSERCVFMVKDI